jgi:AcrR family transcriptional regulator
VAGSTRERILDAAWELFQRRGVAGTTVTQIEAAASLAAGSGSFYRHFRSKDDVFQAAINRELERTAASSEVEREVADHGGDVRVALALEFQRRLDTWRRLRPLIAVVQREHEHLGASRKRVSELLIERNLTVRSQRLARWMDEGLIPRRDPEVLAATILFALSGYSLTLGYFEAAPAHVDDERLVTMLVDLVTGG